MRCPVHEKEMRKVTSTIADCPDVRCPLFYVSKSSETWALSPDWAKDEGFYKGNPLEFLGKTAEEVKKNLGL